MKKLTFFIVLIVLALLAYSFQEIWRPWFGWLAPENIDKTGTAIQSYTGIIALILSIIAFYYQLRESKNKQKNNSEAQNKPPIQSLLQDPAYEATPINKMVFLHMIVLVGFFH